MRQIPRYLIIGSGRLGAHLSHYFKLSGIDFNAWSRSSSIRLEELAQASDVILLAIKDDAIVDFIDQHPEIQDKVLVHCSGSLAIEEAFGMHPLLSFGDKLYDLRTYQSFPFVIDFKVSDFKQYFPTILNPVYFIPKEQKAYYHALCVMSGNFTTVLWCKLFKELEERLGIPKQAACPYLESIMNNLISDHTKALTGPLVRGDRATINKNLDALKADSFLPIYQAFITSWTHEHQ
jgi:predicted short-subunit dehydrogenase-like oxidoreductase (DUF2520 family)